MADTCKAVTTLKTYWSFCPSLGAAIAFLVFFFLTFVAHVTQGIYYRKAYTWVISMSALWQSITYILRIISIKNPSSLGEYAGWFVLILISPLWTNAFVYMVFGRMVWNYTPDATLWRVPAWRFGYCFVILDIVAFIIQVYGAASAETSGNTIAQILRGIHIYMGGVAIQQAFIFCFCAFAYKFWRKLLEQKKTVNDQNPVSPDLSLQSGFTLLYALIAALILISLRIFFRLAEYSNGLQSTIPNHEAFQYCLDSLPMLLALIILNIVHPGAIMRGPMCEIPSRKRRRVEGVRCKGDVRRCVSLELHAICDL
ncbi:hypothetical protein TMatcc_003159 [Talaromyces marneffei ATCC 18224]|uniref:RTA1 domain protein n=1 Tax=Talaromyces marneffei (strain ATCC 18224 / CBS 334.59 / QM 7333) TaxID=441960 RepID=B6Q5X2_TALMQ|nr:uncharacterized protein EYB26_001794 [Talaromyces marneffei]EEA28511.1 conserved hypothetical protein [Talaromyces marneffei ATCC 18224]KAE8555863.1 hypothetical protein EYB25_000561 [Talaromyces marneffei]QGA14141.1 hypothetical protein EYB26_001794 [Talaromyces marneffei]